MINHRIFWNECGIPSFIPLHLPPVTTNSLLILRVSRMESNAIPARFAALLVEAFDFSKLDDDGSEDGKCSISGNFGNFLMDLFITDWLKLGYNCTMESYPALGSFSDGTGMKGSMALEKNDVALLPTKIWESNLDNIEYTLPLYDEFLQIICSYNYTEKFQEQDLIDAYLEFHWSYYLSLILTLIAFIAVWNWCSSLASKLSAQVRIEIEKSRLPSYWIMTCAILDQDQFPKISRIAFTILSLCFSFFFFVMVDCFMLNIMRAELVTIEEPRVVRSYDDIIERDDLQTLFIEGWEEVTFFRDAPKGTKEYEIWQKRRYFYEFSPKSIGDIWQPAIDQRVVGVFRDWFGRGAANLGLSKTREMGLDYLRAIQTKDETGKFFTNALIIQKEAPQILKDYLNERIYRIANSGIVQWYIKERVPHLFADGSEIFLDQFASSNILLPEPPEPEIKLDNVYKFYKVYLSLIIISLLVLIYEIVRQKVNQKLIESREQIRVLTRRERLKRKRMRIRRGIREKIYDLYHKQMRRKMEEKEIGTATSSLDQGPN